MILEPAPGRRSLALALAAFLLGAMGTPRAEALTLEEAVTRALGHSGRLRAARADARAAGSEARGASWSRLPRIEAELGGQRTDHPVLVFSGLLAQERFGAENFGRFDPGTGSFDLSPLNEPDPLTNFRAAVRVRQPLWTGGAVTSRLAASRATAQAIEARADRTAQEVANHTEHSFRLNLLVQQKLDLLRESLDVARAEAARVEGLWSEGLALNSDRRALDAHVSEMEAAFSYAQAESVEARSLLGLLLGADEPVTETLEAPPPTPGEQPLSLPSAVGAAGSRDDVLAAQAAARAARAGMGLARSELLPSLEVSAAAEHNSEDPFGTGGDQWVVGLGARWSFDLGLPSRLAAASARRRAAEERAEAASDLARHEVRVAHGRALAMERRLRALEAATASAEESFHLVQERHTEGLTTTLELMESHNTLTRTRLEAATARHDWTMALASLRLAAGTMDLPEVSR